MSGRTPGGPSADRRRLVASSTVRKRGNGRALRRRVPTAAVALVGVVGLAAAITAAVSPMPALDFVTQGHWVYNTVLHAALHIDGATAHVDARADVPGDPGSQVVQDQSRGYVVGESRITVFGKSSLGVEGTVTPPADEVPLALTAPGGPYLVYRDAGKIVRLGDAPRTVAVGGPVADPVATSDGTLWLYRQDTNLLCPLVKDADVVASCPARVPSGHTGALTVVADRPMFLDTTTSTLLPFDANGVGKAIPVGVPVSPRARPAPSDVDGRVAILDPASNTMHLIDPHTPAAAPVTVALPKGDYDGPTSTGSAVAVVERKSDTVLTYDGHGTKRDTKALPRDSGEPRLTKGEDSRIYVEGTAGTHVLVVDKDGEVADVPVVAPSDKKPGKTAPPATTGPPSRPERDERATPHRTPPSSSDTDDRRPVVPPSPPGAPGNVSASAGNASATVTWDAAASNRATITGYRVSWTGSGGQHGSTDVAGSARSAPVGGLTNGVRYTFSVSATNAAGRGPSASANPVTPAAAASAPRNLSATRSGTDATVGWTAPSSMGGGTLQHYTVSATGMATKTVTGTSTTFSGLPSTGGQTITFTVKAVTKTPDGQTRTGTGASKSITIPDRSIKIERGEDTSSGSCDPPSCAWINVTLTGFDPNTTYSVHGWAAGHEFTAPSEVTTDANGNLVCDDDSCDRIRYDEPGNDVYVFIDLPSGRLQSNTVNWTAG